MLYADRRCRRIALHAVSLPGSCSQWPCRSLVLITASQIIVVDRHGLPGIEQTGRSSHRVLLLRSLGRTLTASNQVTFPDQSQVPITIFTWSVLLQASRVVPGGAAGHYLLGRICKLTSRHQEAEGHFATALSLDPLLWCAFEELCTLGMPPVQSDALPGFASHAAMQAVPSVTLEKAGCVCSSIGDVVSLISACRRKSCLYDASNNCTRFLESMLYH